MQKLPFISCVVLFLDAYTIQGLSKYVFLKLHLGLFLYTLFPPFQQIGFGFEVHKIATMFYKSCSHGTMSTKSDSVKRAVFIFSTSLSYRFTIDLKDFRSCTYPYPAMLPNWIKYQPGPSQKYFGADAFTLLRCALRVQLSVFHRNTIFLQFQQHP